jgi:hypothetical protein
VNSQRKQGGKPGGQKSFSCASKGQTRYKFAHPKKSAN